MLCVLCSVQCSVTLSQHGALLTHGSKHILTPVTICSIRQFVFVNLLFVSGLIVFSNISDPINLFKMEMSDNDLQLDPKNPPKYVNNDDLY